MDHNVVTLDEKGTFHGMGMMAAVTPGKQRHHEVPRRNRECMYGLLGTHL